MAVRQTRRRLRVARLIFFCSKNKRRHHRHRHRLVSSEGVVADAHNAPANLIADTWNGSGSKFTLNVQFIGLIRNRLSESGKLNAERTE